MASTDVKFLSLQKAELAYEVAVRGDTPSSTVDGLRKQISKLTLAFPTEDILESHLDPATDLEEANLSLEKLETQIISLQAKYDPNLLTRALNLYNHIFHRLNRIDCSENVESLSVLIALKANSRALSCYLLSCSRTRHRT